MDKKQWEKEYPQMPEGFHKAVAKTVDEYMRKPEQIQKKRQRRLSGQRCILLAAALSAMLLIGSMLVGAAGKFDFRKVIGLNAGWVPEEIFQKEVAVAGTASQLLEIKELCFDGMRLMVWAVPTEEGKLYEMETLKMEIDGEEISPVLTRQYGKNLVFTANLAEKEVAEPFEVRQEVRVYRENKRYENRKLRYTVNVEAKVQSLPETEWKFEDFTVRASHIKRSSVVVQGLVEVEMDQEQRRRYEAAGEDIIAGLCVLGKNGQELAGLGLFEQEEGAGSHYLDSLQLWFSCQLPSAQEKSVTLRLQRHLPKADDDDWEGLARQQSENLTPFYGEPMELPLASS